MVVKLTDGIFRLLTVQDQVPTARVDAEFTAWHQPPQDASESSSRNLFVAFKQRGSGGGIIEKTLVRRFLSHRSSLSEHSEGGGSSSRGSITGMWAANAEAMQSRTVSIGSLDAVNPLNLAALRAANPRIAVAGHYSTSSSMSSITSVTVEPPHEAGAASQVMLRRKNLKYAGKRVIMALRVKKNLPGDEKRQIIRLLLEKYTTGTPESLSEVHHNHSDLGRRNSLTHQVSDFKLSLAPDV